MEKLDKVIAGLVQCSSENYCCPGCPYEDLMECDDRLMEDALELIRILEAERDFAVNLAQAYQEYVMATLCVEAKDGEAE